MSVTHPDTLKSNSLSPSWFVAREGKGMSEAPSSSPVRSSKQAFLGANRPRVLLVDDEVSVRNSTVAILSDDYEVESAADGRAALALLATMDFDVVCTDLNMPGLNGFELLRRVSHMPRHIGRVLI